MFFTDGVTDAINAREEEFGVERLADLVRANARASAEEIVRAVCDAVAEFVGAGAAFDDLTMVVVKQTSPHSPAARPLSPLLTERQERGEGGKGGDG